MNSPHLSNTLVQPKELLEAAKTAITIIAIMDDLLWELHADALLTIRDADRQYVLELLTMAMADWAWPPDRADLEDEWDDDNYEREVTNCDVVSVTR